MGGVKKTTSLKGQRSPSNNITSLYGNEKCDFRKQNAIFLNMKWFFFSKHKFTVITFVVCPLWLDAEYLVVVVVCLDGFSIYSKFKKSYHNNNKYYLLYSKCGMLIFYIWKIYQHKMINFFLWFLSFYLNLSRIFMARLMMQL